MALLPITLPPGVYRNGTAFQASGRWRDASLVRWTDGTMQPIGGWTTRVTMAAYPIRGAISWRDLGGDRYIAGGTYAGLFVASASGTVTDITIAGLTVGSVDAEQNLGYGGGFYDRTLATLQPRPFTVGLGYTHGYLDEFEPEPHDMPLDAILNDNGVVWPV